MHLGTSPRAVYVISLSTIVPMQATSPEPTGSDYIRELLMVGLIMRSNAAVCSVLTVCSMCLATSAHGATKQRERSARLTLTMGVQIIESQPTVTMVLSSKESTSVEIPMRSLPWHADSSLRLLLLDCIDGTVLTEYVPIDDPGPEPELSVAIPPGQSIRGKVDLSVRFPSLAKPLDREFVLFWTYQPAVVGFKAGQRTAGWFILKAASSRPELK
jgi:hypothetical protein